MSDLRGAAKALLEKMDTSPTEFSVPRPVFDAFEGLRAAIAADAERVIEKDAERWNRIKREFTSPTVGGPYVAMSITVHLTPSKGIRDVTAAVDEMIREDAELLAAAEKEPQT